MTAIGTMLTTAAKASMAAFANAQTPRLPSHQTTVVADTIEQAAQGAARVVLKWTLEPAVAWERHGPLR